MIKKNTQMSDALIYQELNDIQHRIYDLLGLQYSQAIPERESIEYGACDFELNGLSIKFRVAKTTPTKIGQFVTCGNASTKARYNPMTAQIQSILSLSTREKKSISVSLSYLNLFYANKMYSQSTTLEENARFVSILLGKQHSIDRHRKRKHGSWTIF
jgi:hypothetical protein